MTVFSVQKKDESENLHGGDAAKQGALEDQSTAFKAVAIVGYVLTTGLAITGGVLVAKNPKQTPPSSKLSIAPTLGGLVLRGSF
jgi:hypothetical protein